MRIIDLMLEAPMAPPAQSAAAPAQPAAAPAAQHTGMVNKAVSGMGKVASGVNKATSAIQKGFNAYKNLGGKSASTPFDSVDPGLMAKAIDKILAGQALDPAEIAELKELRNKL